MEAVRAMVASALAADGDGLRKMLQGEPGAAAECDIPGAAWGPLGQLLKQQFGVSPLERGARMSAYPVEEVAKLGRLLVQVMNLIDPPEKEPQSILSIDMSAIPLLPSQWQTALDWGARDKVVESFVSEGAQLGEAVTEHMETLQGGWVGDLWVGSTGLRLNGPCGPTVGASSNAEINLSKGAVFGVLDKAGVVPTAMSLAMLQPILPKFTTVTDIRPSNKRSWKKNPTQSHNTRHRLAAYLSQCV